MNKCDFCKYYQPKPKTNEMKCQSPYQATVTLRAEDCNVALDRMMEYFKLSQKEK